MYRLLVISCAMLALVAGSALAESLWPADSTTSMCSDRKAVKVGDVLTVVIVESATSSSTASTDAKKNSKTDVSPGVGPWIRNIPGFQIGGGDELKASGSTSRATTFSAKMTVTVKKINANGNFEIEGTRFVQTNRDKEEIKLTGVVRPQDIATDNTVLSSSIADAKITHTGSGPVSSRQKEGLITKILRILF